MNAPGPGYPQACDAVTVHECLNIEHERARLLRRCRDLREAIAEQRSRDERDALDQDLESSGRTPADLDELRGGDRTTLDDAVVASQILVDEERQRREALGDTNVGRSSREGPSA